MFDVWETYRASGRLSRPAIEGVSLADARAYIQDVDPDGWRGLVIVDSEEAGDRFLIEEHDHGCHEGSYSKEWCPKCHPAS